MKMENDVKMKWTSQIFNNKWIYSVLVWLYLFVFYCGVPGIRDKIMELATVASISRLSNNNVTESSVNYRPGNGSFVEHAPQFTHAALVRVYVLVILGIISLIGNVAILLHICKSRTKRRNSRHTWSAIYTLILHLSIADLLVTVFCIFGEAAWSYTVEWIAGELACKLVKWFQMFALYLSTYVLVLIGIDRWVAVKYPMSSLHMAKRCHRLLILSYILSWIMSLPQVSATLPLVVSFPVSCFNLFWIFVDKKNVFRGSFSSVAIRFLYN